MMYDQYLYLQTQNATRTTSEFQELELQCTYASSVWSLKQAQFQNTVSEQK